MRVSSNGFGLKSKCLVPPSSLPGSSLHFLLSALSSSVAGLVHSLCPFCNQIASVLSRADRLKDVIVTAAQNTLHLLCLSKPGVIPDEPGGR